MQGLLCGQAVEIKVEMKLNLNKATFYIKHRFSLFCFSAVGGFMVKSIYYEAQKGVHARLL